MSDLVPDGIDVEIRLFGPIEVRVGGNALPRLNSRRALWLLAYLALKNGRSVERSRLAGLLWPDSREATALHNLRQTLSNLRRALGPGACLLEADTPRTVRLDPHRAEIDVLAFDAAVADASPLALEQAAGLYRGSMLEGCDEPWAAEARAEREQAYLTVLEALAAVHVTRADYAAAADCLRRAIRTDPYRESACRALMEALSANGEYAAAVDAYRDMRLRLRRDLNAEPDESSAELHSQIRSRAAYAEPSVPRPFQRPGRLPRPLTEMVGRESEIRTVCSFLQRCRMVTLTGLGGIGKTRLAIAVAEEIRSSYRDGAWFVDLAPVVDALLLPKALATALGVRENPGRTILETVADFLSERSLLLVMDNCEHMVQECAEALETLLSMSPGLAVLATSRQNLGVIGELSWQVPSLSLPTNDIVDCDAGQHAPGATSDSLRLSESVRLFVERARHSTPGWKPSASVLETVGEICCRLEGTPLAIELAAARVKALSPRDILARLEDRFALLTQGSRAIPRHQSLRAAMDWSHDLLEPAERALLGRLSVFAGGWSLAAAQFVNVPGPVGRTDVAGLLAGLTDKSLIGYEEGDGYPRYRMLETVREYARDRMREDVGDTGARARHLLYFVDLVEEAEPNLHGPDQASWLDRLEAEHDNLRAALRFSLEPGATVEIAATGAERRHPGLDAPPEAGLRLAGALLRFWLVRGYFTEGREWLAAVLGTAVAQDRTKARAAALNTAGALARYQGDYAEASRYHEESLAINREQGDAPRISASLTNLAIVAADCGDYATARSFYEQALAIDREIGDQHSEGGSLCGLGMVAYMEGDYSSARSFWGRALVISRELGDRGWEALNLGNLGDAARRQGEFSVAKTHLEQSLTINREVGERGGEARDLNNLGRVAAEQGQYEEARSLYRHALVIRSELEIRVEMAWSLEAFASLAAVEADAERAARLCGAAAALRLSLNSPMSPSDRDEFDRTMAAVRHMLGDEAFTAAFEAGEMMNLDLSTAYALSSA